MKLQAFYGSLIGISVIKNVILYEFLLYVQKLVSVYLCLCYRISTEAG